MESMRKDLKLAASGTPHGDAAIRKQMMTKEGIHWRWECDKLKRKNGGTLYSYYSY
jgi:hypothetical protein